MSLKLLTKSSVSVLQCGIRSGIAKEFLKGMNFIKNSPFHYYCYRNAGLPHSSSLLTTNQDNLSSLTCYRRMAGHAKWQNIKHVKAAKDREKNLLCNKYAYLCRLAVREGGADPKLNHKLAVLIEQAKKCSVPSSVVENAMKKDNSKKTQYGTIEILGPAGCIIILEYETDNVSTTRHAFKNTCKKYGANILPGEGRWRAVYDQKGIIKAINQKDGQPFDAEKALDSAIEAGAEEVNTRAEEGEKPYLEFLCAADDLHPVKKEIEKLYEVEEGFVGYVPRSRIEVDKETAAVVDEFLDELGSMGEVIRIFENVE